MQPHEVYYKCIASAAFMHRADQSRLFQPRMISMMLEYSHSELITAFMHHDDIGYIAFKQYVAIKGLMECPVAHHIFRQH